MTEPSKQPQPPGHPVWLPINAVAKPVLGMSPELALSAIDLGQLPIRAASFGKRGLVHLNRGDVAQYVAIQQAPR